MIRDLPDDILEEIFRNLSNSLCNLQNRLVIYGSPISEYRKLHIIASNRISLMYKIKREARSLDKMIMKQLRMMIGCPCPFIGTPPGECIYFAPVVGGENARCRFCNRDKTYHKLKNRMVERHYIGRCNSLMY